MNQNLRTTRRLAWLGFAIVAATAVAAPKAEKAAPTAPTTFATMPATNELAAIWNDADFQKRLIGSYGFASDVEPRMPPDEQAVYRDKIVPLLREDQKKAAVELTALIKPDASAVFDFTLANIYFQSEDLTNAVKHFEAAIAKFPDYRRAHKNLGFALVRDGKMRGSGQAADAHDRAGRRRRQGVRPAGFRLHDSWARMFPPRRPTGRRWCSSRKIWISSSVW